ncbi:anti-anti-sigma factor [Niabella ginsenosidivorans]|uniref:Anti-anti-sigma factor n=1 Tax=Niabella ginsenosidivorans TaxID=1176587 RepID=A0A1A9I770_9BACT|nr:STAS domain-containing protein [Niabella ginsenosidivorans]ANH82541.1 anti-anti-sigma factor [Niabella ginsenosidivorans]
MQVKIDTKEKFHVITPIETALTATMTDDMEAALLPFLQNDVKNVVLDLQQVQGVDTAAAAKLLQIQQKFYENNASFVSCNIQKNVNAFLADSELDDLLNIAPTESEAWDIVQMEEIERDLLDTEDIEFSETDE